MDRSLALLAIGLIFGGGIGFVVAAANDVTLDGHDHAAAGGHDGHDGVAMSHDSDGHASHDMPLSLPAHGTAPKLDITVIKDPMSGWNLHVMTESFRFAPDHASQAHVAGEGHAHVYVNGVKIARLYSPWMHISALPEGAATIEVTLNSNDHRPLAIGDRPIRASVTIAPE